MDKFLILLNLPFLPSSFFVLTERDHGGESTPGLKMAEETTNGTAETRQGSQGKVTPIMQDKLSVHIYIVMHDK